MILLVSTLTKNCINYSRQLVSFSSIEQILLNLATYPHAIDIYTRYAGMIVPEDGGAYRLVYNINLFLTYYKLLLQ